MKPHEVIGWTLLQSTAVTTITSTRIYYGLRPISSVVPCINYYQLNGLSRRNNIESNIFSINCRASTYSAVYNLALAVRNLFGGTSGNGVYGYQNSSFEVTRAHVELDGLIIAEPDTNLYNAPIDVRLIYPIDTVT